MHMHSEETGSTEDKCSASIIVSLLFVDYRLEVIFANKGAAVLSSWQKTKFMLQHASTLLTGTVFICYQSILCRFALSMFK